MSKKHFWRRVLAAVLTLTLSFSILAMPASAAGSNSWAFGGLTTSLNGTCYEWGTEQFLRNELIDYWNNSGQIDTYGLLSEETLNQLLVEAQPKLSSQGFQICSLSLPEEAYMGYSQSLDSRIYWYSKSDIFSLLLHNMVHYSVDWESGALTATNGLTSSTCYPIGFSDSFNEPAFRSAA